MRSYRPRPIPTSLRMRLLRVLVEAGQPVGRVAVRLATSEPQRRVDRLLSDLRRDDLVECGGTWGRPEWTATATGVAYLRMADDLDAPVVVLSRRGPPGPGWRRPAVGSVSTRALRVLVEHGRPMRTREIVGAVGDVESHVVTAGLAFLHGKGVVARVGPKPFTWSPMDAAVAHLARVPVG